MKTNMSTATPKMTIYTEVCIKPAHSGFGMYERGELQVGPETSFGDLGDLEYEGQLTPIEDALQDPDFMAAGIKDIRGKIHNQPGRIYARVIDDGPAGPEVDYCGVEESEVSEDFFN